MVFIIGYIYGPFSKRRGLTIATRVAAIAIIFAFILMNVFVFSAAASLHAGQQGSWQRGHWKYCEDHPEKTETKP